MISLRFGEMESTTNGMRYMQCNFRILYDDKQNKYNYSVFWSINPFPQSEIKASFELKQQ